MKIHHLQDYLYSYVISKSGFIAKLMSKGKKTFPPISPSKSIGISELGVEVGTNVLSTEAGWEECKDAAMLEGIAFLGTQTHLL